MFWVFLWLRQGFRLEPAVPTRRIAVGIHPPIESQKHTKQVRQVSGNDHECKHFVGTHIYRVSLESWSAKDPSIQGLLGEVGAKELPGGGGAGWEAHRAAVSSPPSTKLASAPVHQPMLHVCARRLANEMC